MISKPIEKYLKRADELEIFPAAAERIREIVEREDTSLTELEQAVSLDPTLCVQIVKLANSPFYGMRREVASLRQALFVLGFNATQDLALALALMALGRSERPLSRKLWRHSLRMAVASQMVAHSVGRPDSEAFLSGLLHDLGKFVFLELDEERYAPILEENFNNPEPLLEAEKNLFAFNHGAFTGACLERWDLPDRICIAVRYHHDVETMTPSALGTSYRPAAVIWLANQLEHRMARKQPEDEIAFELSETQQAVTLGVTEKHLKSVADDLDLAVRRLALPS
ncbi:MAG: HDOD domain-containing protein [Pseudomonadota bacterium]